MKCLVIGAGMSVEKDLKKAKAFDGIIIVTDVMVRRACREKIPIDYIVTMEENRKGIRPDLFPIDEMKYTIPRLNRLVTSWRTRPWIIDHFKSIGKKELRFRSAREEYISNVGLFAVRFAYEILKSREIILIGFDHIGDGIMGQKYSEKIQTRWLNDFRVFLTDTPDITITNCSNPTALNMSPIVINNLENMLP